MQKKNQEGKKSRTDEWHGMGRRRFLQAFFFFGEEEAKEKTRAKAHLELNCILCTCCAISSPFSPLSSTQHCSET
jgi:hypothetical protein